MYIHFNILYESNAAKSQLYIFYFARSGALLLLIIFFTQDDNNSGLVPLSFIIFEKLLHTRLPTTALLQW